MFLSYISFIYFACARVNMCHCVHVKVRGQLVCGSGSFLIWALGNWMLVVRLDGKHPYWLSHLTCAFIFDCMRACVICVYVSAVIHVLCCGCGGQRMTTLNFSRQDFSFFLRHDILQINWFKSFWEIFLFLPSIFPGISGVCRCSWLFMWVSRISLRFSDL